MHHSPSLSLRSLLALAMAPAAAAAIVQTPKLAEGIANGIKSVLDVLAPGHEVQGQPSGADGVTGGLGPIPTVLVAPSGTLAGVTAFIPEPKSALEEAAEKYVRACAKVNALDALVSSAHEALQKAEQNLRAAQDVKKEAAKALSLADTAAFGVDVNGVYVRGPIQKQ